MSDSASKTAAQRIRVYLDSQGVSLEDFQVVEIETRIQDSMRESQVELFTEMLGAMRSMEHSVRELRDTVEDMRVPLTAVASSAALEAKAVESGIANRRLFLQKAIIPTVITIGTIASTVAAAAAGYFFGGG